MQVSSRSISFSFSSLAALFMVLGCQPLFADSRSVNDRFMQLGDVNPDRAEQLQSEVGPAYVGTWDIELDPSVFSAPPFDELSMKMPENIAAQIEFVVGHSLEFADPISESPMILDLETAHKGLGGVVTYAGTIRGDDGSLVAISVREGEVLGKIHDSKDYSYIIRKRPRHKEETLTVIQHTALPRPDAEHRHDHGISGSSRVELGRGSSASGAEPMGSGGGTVRVLFMYTPAAAASNNVTLVANNLIAQFNQSLNLSNVNTSNSVVLADIHSIGNNLTTYNERCNSQIVAKEGLNNGQFPEKSA